MAPIEWFVKKFLGCYKSTINKRKIGACESDILVEAHKIYEQDEQKKIIDEHAWFLLKDEPKWKGDSIENSSKRTKVNNYGEYSSSSNPWMPIDCSDYDQASLVTRPMGQKAVKKKSKGKIKWNIF